MLTLNSVKEKIINSAFDIFMDKGYVETTVSQISREAGVAYGTVYFHFRKGKDDVLLKIFTFVMEEFYQVLDQEFQVQTVQQNKEIIYGQMMSSFKIVDKNRRIMQVVWEAKGKSEIVYHTLHQLKERFIYRIAEDLKYNRENGLTASKDDLLNARALMHMIWGFIWEYTLSEQFKANEIANAITTIYMEGVYS